MFAWYALYLKFEYNHNPQGRIQDLVRGCYTYTVADETPFVADFFSGVCMAQCDCMHKLFSANASIIFPSQDQKKGSQPTATSINAHYLAFLQILEPLCAPSPPSPLDQDYLRSSTEET